MRSSKRPRHVFAAVALPIRLGVIIAVMCDGTAVTAGAVNTCRLAVLVNQHLNVSLLCVVAKGVSYFLGWVKLSHAQTSRMFLSAVTAADRHLPNRTKVFNFVLKTVHGLRSLRVGSGSLRRGARICRVGLHRVEHVGLPLKIWLRLGDRGGSLRMRGLSGGEA